MKKSTKSDAAKPAKATTPAQPAPSPAYKAKTPSKPKAAKTDTTPAKVTAGTAPSVSTDVAAASAPLVKTSPVVPQTTVVVAQIDVGFGNTLYIRGEGPGLSWEKGVALDCVADDRWSHTVPETSKPIVFKFLINDQTWCKGDDFVAQPGSTVTVSPIF
jgi:hypothetical protein